MLLLLFPVYVFFFLFVCCHFWFAPQTLWWWLGFGSSKDNSFVYSINIMIWIGLNKVGFCICLCLCRCVTVYFMSFFNALVSFEIVAFIFYIARTTLWFRNRFVHFFMLSLYGMDVGKSLQFTTNRLQWVVRASFNL